MDAARRDDPTTVPVTPAAPQDGAAGASAAPDSSAAPAADPAEAPAPAEELAETPEHAADAAQAEAQEAAHEVEHDLEALLARAGERDEYLALAQRTQADFDNFRKRAARDHKAAEERGAARLARELLPALDDLALALDAAGATAGEDDSVVGGMRLVQQELLAALARTGIEPFSPQGEVFDPTVHEAMAQNAVEGAESGTVVEVYSPGYLINGDVLRPARVVVAA